MDYGSGDGPRAPSIGRRRLKIQHGVDYLNKMKIMHHRRGLMQCFYVYFGSMVFAVAAF